MKTVQTPADLLDRVARECGGTVESFTGGVVQMAAVIECLYHVAERINDEPKVEVDWTPIVEMLRRSRAEFPNIYSGLSAITAAGRP